MKEPEEGWNEPIAEGLWKPDELFGIPRHANWLHCVWMLLAMIDDLGWLYASAIMHAALAALTAVEPEWPAVFSDLLYEPGELEA